MVTAVDIDYTDLVTMIDEADKKDRPNWMIEEARALSRQLDKPGSYEDRFQIQQSKWFWNRDWESGLRSRKITSIGGDLSYYQLVVDDFVDLAAALSPVGPVHTPAKKYNKPSGNRPGPGEYRDSFVYFDGAKNGVRKITAPSGHKFRGPVVVISNDADYAAAIEEPGHGWYNVHRELNVYLRRSARMTTIMQMLKVRWYGIHSIFLTSGVNPNYGPPGDIVAPCIVIGPRQWTKPARPKVLR